MTDKKTRAAPLVCQKGIAECNITLLRHSVEQRWVKFRKWEPIAKKATNNVKKNSPKIQYR